MVFRRSKNAKIINYYFDTIENNDTEKSDGKWTMCDKNVRFSIMKKVIF